MRGNPVNIFFLKKYDTHLSYLSFLLPLSLTSSARARGGRRRERRQRPRPRLGRERLGRAPASATGQRHGDGDGCGRGKGRSTHGSGRGGQMVGADRRCAGALGQGGARRRAVGGGQAVGAWGQERNAGRARRAALWRALEAAGYDDESAALSSSTSMATSPLLRWGSGRHRGCPSRWWPRRSWCSLPWRRW